MDVEQAKKLGNGADGVGDVDSETWDELENSPEKVRKAYASRAATCQAEYAMMAYPDDSPRPHGGGH